MAKASPFGLIGTIASAISGKKETTTVTPISPTVITGPGGGPVTGTSADVITGGVSGGTSRRRGSGGEALGGVIPSVISGVSNAEAYRRKQELIVREREKIREQQKKELSRLKQSQQINIGIMEREAKTNEQINKQIIEQQKYYQSLVDKNKLSQEEANSKLNKVISTYSEEIRKKNIPNLKVEESIKPTMESMIEGYSTKNYNKQLNKLYNQVDKISNPLIKTIVKKRIGQEVFATGLILKSNTITKATDRFVKRSASNTVLLPKNLWTLVTNPSNIKDVPKAVYDDFKDTIQLIKTSPSEAIAKVGSDILTGMIVGEIFKPIGKLTTNVATRLSTKFSGVAKVGGKLVIKGKDITIKVVGSIPKQSLRGQVGLAGKAVNAISSQAQSLLSYVKRNKVIRKPLGLTKTGKTIESSLSNYGKKLLNKLDDGKITANEIIKLNSMVKKLGSKGILERSFFADPFSRVRPSRLGVVATKEGNIFDLLSGKATIKAQKPQILLFENVKIQKLPKTLSSIKSKLLSGKTLSKLETAKLLTWQQRVTGKFKPIGFVTRESEITLAPKEIIKRVKKVGVTLVNGKRVPIISTKVVKPSKYLSNLLSKSSLKMSTKELSKLAKQLSKETGFKYSASSVKQGLKYYPLGRKLASYSTLALSRYTKPASYLKTITSRVNLSSLKYTSKKQPYIKTKYGIKFISKGSIGKVSKGKVSISYKVPDYRIKYPKYPYPTYPISKPPIYPTKYKKGGVSKPPYYPTRIPSIVPPSKKIRISPSPIKTISKSKPVPVFNVFGKSGKRFVKLNTKPLIKNDALSRGAFAIDVTTSKRFKIVPAGKTKTVGVLRKGEQNYFNRAGYKLREYRVRGGRAFAIKPNYIERTKYGIDTRGEKRGLSIAKFIRQQNGKINKPRKITVSQRKVMLNNLAKARKVLAKKRR